MLSVVRKTSTVKSSFPELNGKDIIWMFARMDVLEKFFQSCISALGIANPILPPKYGRYASFTMRAQVTGFPYYPCSVSYVKVSHF